jgi:hypothetical protein
MEESFYDSPKEEKACLVNSINFLIYLKEPWKLAKNHPETLNALNTTNSTLSLITNSFEKYLNENQKTQLTELIIDYLKYVYENLKENFMKYNHLCKRDSFSLNQAMVTELNKKTEILFKLSLLMWNLADKSIEFCCKFQTLMGVQVLFKYLNDQPIVENVLKHLKLEKTENFYIHLAHTFKSFNGTIHNLSKYIHMFAKEWKDTNGISNLLKMVENFKEIPSFYSNMRLLAYFGLINLIKFYKTDLERLFELETILKEIVQLTYDCSKQLDNENKYKLQRKLYKLTIDSTVYEEVLIISSREIIWSLVELLNFCYKLCELDEKYKYFLYENEHFRIALKQILYNGNEVEKEHVLRLIYRFCFDERITKSIRNDLNFYSFLLGLSTNKYLGEKNILTKYANSIIFLLENNLNDYVYI